MTAHAPRSAHPRMLAAPPAPGAAARYFARSSPVFILALFLSSLFLAAGCERKTASLDRGPTGGARIEFARVIGSIGDTPGKFTYPRAMRADPVSKTLWAIDRSGRVQEIDPASGRCLTMFKMDPVDRGFPVGLTVAPGIDSKGNWTDRLLYIADTHNYRVVIVEPPARTPDPAPDSSPDSHFAPLIAQPTIVAQFGSYGVGPGQFIYPTDVAVLTDPEGKRVERIYIAEYGSNDRISVFDADRNFLFSFGAFGSSAAPDLIQFNRPQTIKITGQPGDPDRELVVADGRNHRIGVFSLDGQLKRWLGSADEPGQKPGRFLYPWGIVLLDDNSALICEAQNCRLQRIDLATGESLGIWARPGAGPGELNMPWAIDAIDGEIFVSDGRNNRIVVINRSDLRSRRRLSPPP